MAQSTSTAQADAFAGSEREEKATARFGRNDRYGWCVLGRFGQGATVKSLLLKTQ